ncbi:MAG: hypothetical protein HYU69_11110 [Bacteroidetes bacterium]|nr:hypothetical protein [Bacteroidota bacterium]
MNYDKVLADLIKGLNKSEKRYFKIDAGRHTIGEENNYVKLFNLFERQEDHSKVFAKTPAKNLSATKRHLYQTVLKSMRGYSEKFSGFQLINGILSDVSYLYSKGLYSQCQLLLDKAKKIAYDYERFEQLITIIFWQKIFSGADPSDKGYRSLQKLHQEDQKILRILQDIDELEVVEHEILSFGRRKGFARTKKEIKRMHRFMTRPILKNSPKNRPLRVNVPYYVAYSLYFADTHQMAKSYNYRKKAVELYESKPLLVSEYFKSYMGLMHNLMVSQRKLKKFTGLLESIERLRSTPTDSLHKASAIFSASYISELNLYVNRGQFENGIKLVPEIEKGLRDFKDQLSNEHVLIFQCNIAYMYFGNEEFRSALKWLNYILQNEDKYLREDVQVFVRILSLIIHYELDNPDVVTYYERAVTRFLTKKSHRLKTEKAVLNFVKRNIQKTNTKEELSRTFLKLKNEIKEYFKDPIENRIREDFDILSWINSKIEGRPFAEMIRNKYK